MGGLSRRNTVIEEHADAVVVDGGASLNKPGPWPADDALQGQRRLKAKLMLDAYALAGIDAMALSASDWQLGSETVREWIELLELPVLAANLTCDGAAPYPGGTVVNAGGRRVGIVGVTEGPVDGCEVSPPAPAIAAAVADLGAVDVVLGLLPYTDLKGWVAVGAGPVPIDIAIDARGRLPVAGADMRADAMVVGAGLRGKTLGVLRLSFGEEGADWYAAGAAESLAMEVARAEQRVSGSAGRIESMPEGPGRELVELQLAAYRDKAARLQSALDDLDTAGASLLHIEHVDLKDTVADHEATLALVSTAKQQITTVSGSDPRRFVPRIVSSGPFVGGEACASCHKSEHLQWSRTGHARAFGTLVANDSALDEACWSCHVTGAMAEGGPQLPTESAGFRDVQCEACHGPGRAHAEDPESVKPVRDPASAVCLSCHDGDRDGGRFDLPTYRAKVVHTAPAE